MDFKRRVSWVKILKGHSRGKKNLGFVVGMKWRGVSIHHVGDVKYKRLVFSYVHQGVVCPSKGLPLPKVMTIISK